MTEAPTDPLLSLPDNQIIERIRDKSVEEKLRFSLISDRSKNLVSSIQIKGTSINVTIGSSIRIAIKTSENELILRFYTESDIYWGMGAYGRKKKLSTPRSVDVEVIDQDGSGSYSSTWPNNTLTMQYWLKHLQDVFNYSPKIDTISFLTHSPQFDIDDIKEVFGKATKVNVCNVGCKVYHSLVLQKMSPIEKLSTRSSEFQNSRIPEVILMQNFTGLDIREIDIDHPTRMTLNDLLMTNTKALTIDILQMSPKDFNKFIKLWQSGSNPHMEYLSIQYVNAMENDNETIMRGINHQVIPAVERRKFKSVGFGKPVLVKGGLDIHRMDGTKATIQINPSAGTPIATTKPLITTAPVMAEAPAHPLLSLSDDEIIQKLRVMKIEEILEFSLISERCKELVKSIQKAYSFRVSIGSGIAVNIGFNSKSVRLTFYREPDMYWRIGAYGRKKKLTEPQSVFVEVESYTDNFGKTTFEWTKKEFKMKDWIKNLQSIFNYHKIDHIFFGENSSEFDMDDIKEAFGNTTGVTTDVRIGDTGCLVFNQMVLQKFFPIEKLSIENENFQDSKIRPDVLMQNRASLRIWGSGVDVATIITLDDLLLINSKVIYVENLQMSSKQLNKFIKLWQKGSNPHMEQLCIELRNLEEADEGIIMKGIKHEVIPANHMREFKSDVFSEPDEIIGGLEFYRMDGVKATLQFAYDWDFPMVEMYAKPSITIAPVMAGAPTHPLLSLPDDEIIQNLRKMSLEEILKFSLISKRCKELVKSSKIGEIEGTSISVSIGNDIVVNIGIKSKNVRLVFYREPDMYWGIGAYGRKKKLTEPQSILVEVTSYTDNFRKTTFEWTKKESTMKDWIKHLQSIFNYHKIDHIFFGENSSEFDMDDIKEAFGNTTDVTINVRIGDTGCLVFNQMILHKFFPIEKLTIENENFQDSKIPSSVLMQNRAFLSIWGSGVDVATIITLDELLLINSKRIIIENLQMSSKQLNKFIKLWQKGSSPHMEHLWIECPNLEEADEGIIMKGIKHEVIPANHMREFKSVGFSKPDEIIGGLDFYRNDGVKATIKFDHEFGDPTFEMYVWFDHWFVE